MINIIPQVHAASARCAAFALCILVFCAGCATQLERPEDVAGTYRLRGRQVHDVLSVRPDGRYVRRFTVPDGTVVTDSSVWEIERSSGEPKIVFANFLGSWVAGAFPDIPQRRGYWSTVAERTLVGTVRLRVDADFGLEYVREPRSAD